MRNMMTASLQKIGTLGRLWISILLILWILFSPLKTFLLYTGDGTVIRSYHARYYASNLGNGTPEAAEVKNETATLGTTAESSAASSSCLPTIAYLNQRRVIAYDRGCLWAVEKLYPHCSTEVNPKSTAQCFILYDKPIFTSNTTKSESAVTTDDSMPIVMTLPGFTSIYADILIDLLSGSCSLDGVCLQANLPLLFETVATNASLELLQAIQAVQTVADLGDPEDIVLSVADQAATMFTGDFVFGLVTSSLCPNALCFSNGASNSFIKSVGALSTLVSDTRSADQTDNWFCFEDCNKTAMSIGMNSGYISGITMLNARGFLEMHSCGQLVADLMQLKDDEPHTLRRIPSELALYLHCPAFKQGILDDLEYLTSISSRLTLKVEQHSAAGIGYLKDISVTRTVAQAGVTTAKAADIVRGIYDGQNAGYIANTAWCNYFNDTVYAFDSDLELLTEPVLAAARSCLQRRWVDTYRRTIWITRLSIEGSIVIRGAKANVTLVLRDPAMVDFVEKQLAAISLGGSFSSSSPATRLSSSAPATPLDRRYITRGMALDGEALSNYTARVLDLIFPNATGMLPLTLNGATERVILKSSGMSPMLTLEPRRRAYVNADRRQFTNTAPLIASCVGSPCQASNPFYLPSDQSMVMFDSAGLSYRVIEDDVAGRLRASVRDLTTAKNSIYAMEFYGRSCPHYPNWIVIRGDRSLHESSEVDVSLVTASTILESRLGYKEACLVSSYAQFSASYPADLTANATEGEYQADGCSFRLHRMTLLNPVECGSTIRGDKDNGRLNVYDSSANENLIALRPSLLETVETTANGLQSYENGIIYVGILINMMYTFRLLTQILLRLMIVKKVLGTFDSQTARRDILFRYNGPLIEFVDYTERQVARCSIIEKIALCLPSMVTMARMIRPMPLLRRGVIASEQYVLVSDGAFQIGTSATDWLVWLIAAMSIGSVMTAYPEMSGIAVTARLRRWASATFSAMVLILSSSGVCVIAPDVLPDWMLSRVEIGLLAVCWSVGVAVLLQEPIDKKNVSVKPKDALSAGAALEQLGLAADLVLPPAMIYPGPDKSSSKVMVNVFWLVNYVMEGFLMSSSGGSQSSITKRNVRSTLDNTIWPFALILFRPGHLEVKMCSEVPKDGVRLGTLPNGTTVYFDSLMQEEGQSRSQADAGTEDNIVVYSRALLEGYLAE